MTKEQLVVENRRLKAEISRLKHAMVKAEELSVEQFKRMQEAERRARELWNELVMANEEAEV